MNRRIGDIYRVTVDDERVAYFEHAADDRTQLGSNVIRVFRQRYSKDDPPSEAAIIADEVDFCVHVALPVGVKLGSWDKVGYSPALSKPDVLFCICNEPGSSVTVSKDWSGWRIEESMRRGSASDVRVAENGMVINPRSVLHRIRTGRYDFVYPDYG